MKASADIARQLPQNPEAERVLLGILLIASTGRDLLDLSPDCFFLPQNRAIFKAITELRSAGKPVDLLSCHEHLERAGDLEKAGGIGYLASVVDGIPVKLDVSHQVRVLQESAARRRLIHFAEAIQERAFQGTHEAAALADRAIDELSSLARQSVADKDEGINYFDAASSLLQELQSDSGIRIFTDVTEIDRIIGGFRAGELVLITGGTGMGKTIFAQQIRRRACRDGRHTLYCSAEMRAQHLLSRELATQSGVKPWKMRISEQLTDRDWQLLVEASSHQCKQCRVLDGELSLSRIRRVSRRMKSAALDLVIADYDELIDADGENEFEQQRVLVRGLKSLAMELSIPAILISQLRKPVSGEDVKRPTLQSLYGSGAKTKHASTVIFVDREFVRDLCGDETAAQIVILKNRDGKVGRTEAKFSTTFLRFESVPAQEPASWGESAKGGSE